MSHPTIEQLRLAARALPRIERLVLVLHYFEGLTMAEIAVVLELPEPHVNQLHTELLTRLGIDNPYRRSEFAA